MDQSEILEFLKKDAGAFEAYEVRTFRCYRESRDGSGTQTVTVTILDAGPSVDARYHVRAETEDGRVATGNPDSSLFGALKFVHWGNLDRG